MAPLRAIGTFFMRVYQVPPDMNEKEKVIGGILNINQFFWILGGLIFGAVVFALLFTLTSIIQIAAFFGLVCCLSGTPFALYKPNGLTLYQYITYKRKFKNKVQKLPNKRKEVKF